MKMIMASSQEAKNAYTLTRALQKRFAQKLNELSKKYGQNKEFEEVLWLRDEGTHGGGSRFEARDESLFNTASINVSQVHYDDMKEKKLQSATAISTIIHPNNPKLPSIHIHISLTCLRDSHSYWRVMADLNPSIENEDDKQKFETAIKELSKEKYEEGVKQGEKYFFIPTLNRHRGVSHFYLENYKTDDKKADYDFAMNFGEGIIDTYVEILENAIQQRALFSVEDIKQQLDYHTLYLFQVLTLDRGTTSGLLVHNQNDAGIMGSLPKYINKQLLNSWITKVPNIQKSLVQDLVSCISDKGLIDIDTKLRLANKVREFYKNNKEALTHQASGNTIPSTVQNHKK